MRQPLRTLRIRPDFSQIESLSLSAEFLNGLLSADGRAAALDRLNLVNNGHHHLKYADRCKNTVVGVKIGRDQCRAHALDDFAMNLGVDREKR